MSKFPWPMDKPIDSFVGMQFDTAQFHLYAEYLFHRLKKAESERDAAVAMAEGFMIQEEQE